MKIKKLFEAEDEELLFERKTRVQRHNEKQAKRDKKLRQKEQQSSDDLQADKPQGSRQIETTIEQKLNSNEPYTDIKEDIQSWIDACAREKG